ncbi:hypothetical protein U1Q18_021316 [Sarracenia purpurea var. burkii]
MEDGGGARLKISADDVISKLKDDGDFDRLRLKIIRRLKENEEVRNGIISMVKQSTALNQPGALNLKPRELSDAIHQEVGDKAMNQISDSLWEIIRSPDGMKSEITETVQSVYNKLLHPGGNEEGGSSLPNSLVPVQMPAENMVAQTAPPSGMDMSDYDPKEPPGFSLSNHHQKTYVEQPTEELELPIPRDLGPIEDQNRSLDHPEGAIEPGNEGGGPPGFSAVEESKQPCDGSDDDPDLPPGFG